MLIILMDEFDTFETTDNNTFDIIEEKIVIRIDKRNARKSTSIVEGWNIEKDEMKLHLKKLKTSLGCNGSIKKDENDKNLIILQGDKRCELINYLISNNIEESNITVVG